MWRGSEGEMGKVAAERKWVGKVGTPDIVSDEVRSEVRDHENIVDVGFKLGTVGEQAGGWRVQL